MPNSINDLSTASGLQAGDLIPVWQAESGRARAASVGTLAAKVSELIEGPPDNSTYSVLGSDNNFSYTVSPDSPGASVWAQLSMLATAPAATISMPSADSRGNGQEVLVTVSHAITALTVSGSGAAVKGAPTTLGPNGFFRMRYDNVGNAWYRVG